MTDSPVIFESRFTFNRLYKPVFTTQARYIDCWGGRGRGGSHFATDYFLYLIQQPDYFRGYLMREVLNDVRESLFRDMLDRMDEKGIDYKSRTSRFLVNDHHMSITDLVTGNRILSKGFKKQSGKQTAKLKSLAGATHVIIEEAEEVEEDEFMKLDDSFRTKKGNIQIIRLFNPPRKNHWLIKKYYNLQEASLIDHQGDIVEGYYHATPKQIPNFLSIFSTYKDNLRNLNPTFVANLESYQISRPDWYYTTVLGLVSEGAKGRIYKNWRPFPAKDFDSIPYPSAYGLDYGYSTDPVALIEVKAHNNKRWIRQLIYKPGLSNASLATRMKAVGVGKKVIVPDSAEPKSNDDLIRDGFNIHPAVKGADSVLFGIRHLQGLEVYYTDDSYDLENEYQEYRWQLDANKEPTDQPEDKNNHLMDAFRYVDTKLYTTPPPPVRPNRPQNRSYGSGR
ncbi:PBSX family phage terminase large subunit [Spirosoma aerolatum]|uniref:PBSX family phage terminase large subunit n=1 Tax=Spirosoma aerolatum TaxID=1211326 RepID=UPI0009ABB9F8|nr:phage terminase large subunit [Spirosoma aerolatum]